MISNRITSVRGGDTARYADTLLLLLDELLPEPPDELLLFEELELLLDAE